MTNKERRRQAKSMNNCWGRHLEQCMFGWATSKGTPSDCFNWGNQKDLREFIMSEESAIFKMGLTEKSIPHSLNSFWCN